MTALRLAEHVAHTVDVDRMLDSMSPDQFDEWCLKDRVEPIGYEATRNILALIGVTVAQAAGGKNMKVQHFMPWIDTGPIQQSTEQMQAAMSVVPGAVYVTSG